MRGNSFGTGLGIALFFVLGGVGLFVAAEAELIDFTPGIDAGDDTVADTLRMIGLIWAGVGLLLVALFAGLRMRGAARERLVRTGLPGTAVVRSAEQTGVYVNQNPQMRFDLELTTDDGMPPRSLTKKAIVPMIALGRFGQGTALPVRVDPNDRDDFEILWEELPPPGGGGQAQPEPQERLDRLEELRRRGQITPSEYDEKRREILDHL